MKLPSILSFTLAMTLFGSANAVVLSLGDVDIGIAYEDDAWDLHVHDETADEEYEPGDATLFVAAGAQTTVSADPQKSFLGSPGDAVWILPQDQDPNLLYLGLATEEIDSGTFVGDTLTFNLVSVSGPGSFSLYTEDGLGVVTKFFDSGDGISAADSITLSTSTHQHFNWAFTATGLYSVQFEASAVLPGGMATSSGPVAYQFEVVPEPGTVGMLVVAGLAVGGWVVGRRRAARS